MYLPKHFEVAELNRLHEAIEAYSFALIISGPDADLQASHLPLLLDRDQGSWGTLVGHMARANGQWHTAAGQKVLAVFAGPHAYISPAWYEAEEVVPTWNYVAVHAYGTLTPIEEPAELRAIVARTVRHYESGRDQPWRLDERADYIDRLLPHIVGFRIPIERLEGKWKLNQNHPPARRQKVAKALSGSGREDDREIGKLMAGEIEN
jgi:transcriptional regulator